MISDPARVLAAAQAERALRRMGAQPEDVDLVDEIARRVRAGDFTAREIQQAAAIEAARGDRDDLGFALARALGDKAESARALGKLLSRLQGPVIRRMGGAGADGLLWGLDWPRRCWRSDSVFGAASVSAARPSNTHAA